MYKIIAICFLKQSRNGRVLEKGKLREKPSKCSSLQPISHLCKFFVSYKLDLLHSYSSV